MKKLINLTKFALVALMLCVGFVSCTDDEVTPDPFTLSITTDPADAKVLINGKEAKTFTTKTNVAEKITYEVSKEGYETLTGEHNVTKTETLELKLVQNALHTLTIVPVPADAKVVINGVEAKTYTTKTKEAEKVTYEVSHKDYPTKSGELTLDKSANITVDLTKVDQAVEVTYTLVIIPTPDYATVKINGIVTKTFTTKSDKPEEIEWEVKQEGFETQSGKHNITKSETLEINLEQKTLTLTIEPTPADAKVTINGEDTKTFSTSKPYGEEVTYEVSKDGYATVKEKHKITETFTLPITLKKAEKYLAAVKNADNKWGYINKEGNTIIEFQYQLATPFANGIAVVQKEDGKWIIIDKTGEQTATIDGDYTSVSPFYGEYAIVGVGKGWRQKFGMINKSGKEIIKCVNQELEPFVDGLAKYLVGGGNGGYYNEDGAVVFKADDSRFNPRGGIGFVKTDSKWNMIDKTGTRIGNFQFKNAYSFTSPNEDFYAYKGGSTSNLIAAVEIKGEGYGNDYHGYINEKGEAFNDVKYKGAYPFSEGLAVVKISEEGSYNRLPGIMKTDGTMLVECTDEYKDFKFVFTDGVIGTLKGQKWGFMDKTGRVLVEPTYYKVNYFVDGIVSVMRDRAEDLWGAIDKTGKQVLDFKYIKVYNSSQGLILAQEGFGETAIFKFFDHSGKELINNNYKAAWYFTEVDAELPYWTRLDHPIGAKIILEYPAHIR